MQTIRENCCINKVSLKSNCEMVENNVIKSSSFEGYEKLKTVGKGAFGTATLYKRLSDNMHVVMKEVFLADMTRDERKLALNEVEVLSFLKHPNIIRYMGSFEKDGTLIIIMEYANGGNLAQLISGKKIRKESFSEKSILQIIYQISSALMYMHNNKILHRDLKTANIFLNKNGAIKVGDFGISKVLSTINQAQTIIGTPYYLSPEMCEGKDYNEKSDIWALGCILYELLCLRRPFEAPTLPILVQKITSCEYESVPTNYSEGLHNLVRSILQKNWEQRPTAQDIYENLIPKMTRNIEILTDVNILFSQAADEGAIIERSLLYRISLNNGISNPVTYELPNKKFIHFSCSKSHYIAVASDNSVYTWGDDCSGQLAQGKPAFYRKHPICVDFLQGKDVVKSAAGNKFSLFLTKRGLILSCGDGRNGCLGHGDWNNLLRPKLIENLLSASITDIQCAADHVLALSNNGNVYVWGLGEDGQLGLGNKKFCCSPTLLALNNIDGPIDKIYTGSNASLLINSNGQILVCGNNCNNKLGLKNMEKVDKFTLIKDIREKIKFASLGMSHTLLLTGIGNVLALGCNSGAQFGKGNTKAYSSPQYIKISNSNIEFLKSGPSFSLAITSNNVLYFWGTYYKNGSNDPELSMTTNLMANIKLEELKPSLGTAEYVMEPKSILALYSSPENIEKNNILWFGGLEAQENGILCLVHTTTQPPINKDIPSRRSVSVPTWKNSLKIPSSETTLPNTPHVD